MAEVLISLISQNCFCLHTHIDVIGCYCYYCWCIDDSVTIEQNLIDSDWIEIHWFSIVKMSAPRSPFGYILWLCTLAYRASNNFVRTYAIYVNQKLWLFVPLIRWNGYNSLSIVRSLRPVQLPHCLYNWPLTLRFVSGCRTILHQNALLPKTVVH